MTLQNRYLKTTVPKIITMGQYVSSTFTLYGRDKITDKWTELVSYENGNPLSRFKYAVYQFVLRKKFHHVKALYLYCGYGRVCKAYLSLTNDTPYLYIDFCDDDTAQQFDNCKEQLATVLTDITWLQPEFSKSWSAIQAEETWRRKYQNYKLDMKM